MYAMESNATQEFFQKPFGFGGKFWRWLGLALTVLGIITMFASDATRTFGIRMIMVGIIIAAITRSQKHPFIVLTPETFSIRMGMGKKYKTIVKEQIERIDINDKAIVVIPKQGRRIKIGHRLFKKEVWAAMQEPIRAFAESMNSHLNRPPTNRLFEIPVRVRRGSSCPMPANLIGAYVFCYASAQNHLDATRNAVLQLARDGYIFEELVGGKVHERDPMQWNVYVNSTWPECKDSFPKQEEMPRLIATGAVFFGPFIGYERE